MTRLWGQYLPCWRKSKAAKKERDLSEDKKIMEQMNRVEKEAVSSDQQAHLSPEETLFVQVTRNVTRKKGKWDRFGPDAK